MFSRPHVISALEAQRESFASYEWRNGQALQRYEQALAWLATQGQEQVLQQLADIGRPGALPTPERVVGQAIVRPFDPAGSGRGHGAHRAPGESTEPGFPWGNHEQARAWAIDVLQGVRTLAVDGSQITPSRDFSIPVGAVQVGWYENPHDAEGRYIKDLRFEVLPPESLADVGQESGRYPDLQVNLRRFELECQVLVEAMQRLAGEQQAAVCFFDGSLIISFANQMRPELQRGYLQAVRSLIGASRETRVPLVGYVDTSYASDLLSMLRWLRGEEDAPALSDGVLLRESMAWGDRTEAFVCARDDGLFERSSAELDYYAQVLFLYLKTTFDSAPVRLDLPLWVLEAGELERVLDVVRAECVVGTGYPYVVETADAVAVISNADRERFYRTFQEFMQRLNLDLRYSRKATSKRQRR